MGWLCLNGQDLLSLRYPPAKIWGITLAEALVYSDNGNDPAVAGIRPEPAPEKPELEDVIEREFSRAEDCSRSGSYSKAIELYHNLIPLADSAESIFINKQIVIAKMANLYLKQLDFSNALSCFREVSKKKIDRNLVEKLMEKAANETASQKEQLEVNDFYLKMNCLTYSGIILAELNRFEESESMFEEVFSCSELMEKMDIATRTQLNTVEFEEKYFNLAIAYFYKGLSLKMQGKDPSEYYNKSVKYMESRGHDPFLITLFAIAENKAESRKKRKVYLEFAEKLASKFDFDLSISQFTGSRNVVIDVKDDYGFLNSSLVIKIGLEKSKLQQEFNLLSELHERFPEHSAEPLVIYRSKTPIFVNNRLVRKNAYFMLLRRAPGANVFDALKKHAYYPGKRIMESQGISKLDLASKMTEILEDFHEFGKGLKLKNPAKGHYSSKIRGTFLKYLSIEGKEAEDFLSIYKSCVEKEIEKAPVDFYTDANLKNWSISKDGLKKYDFESRNALPCMLELVSIIEFPRMYLSKEEQQEAIDSYYWARINIDSSFTISKKGFDHLYKVASLHRHLEFCGYRSRDYKESAAGLNSAVMMNNLTYMCYHLQSAIERAEELGFMELKSKLEKIKEMGIPG